MAKIVKKYKGYVIKETNENDNTTYKYWVFTPDEDYYPEWECDNLQEAIEFIKDQVE